MPLDTNFIQVHCKIPSEKETKYKNYNTTNWDNVKTLYNIFKIEIAYLQLFVLHVQKEFCLTLGRTSKLIPPPLYKGGGGDGTPPRSFRYIKA